MDSRRPNIVLIIAHDLGTHFGPYGFAEGTSTRLDRFASESVRLTRHFVTSPGCSPSRASLVTGRYPHANGQFGLAHLGWDLHRDEATLPQVLRESGYRTALFGIWHLHAWSLSGFDDLSDDVSCADSSPEGPAEIASRRAADWLRSRRGDDTPFYLHVGFWEPHRPFAGHEREPGAWPDVDPDTVRVPGHLHDNAATRGELAQFERAVGMVDDGVGRILDALESSGHAENTIVLFTSDHGAAFPRAKGTLYDPGVQVGLLARWPGHLAPGGTFDPLTSNVDVMPTLLEAAGVDCPACVQGTSFLGALLGREDAELPDAVFAEKTYHEHYDPIRAVRTGRWKYVRNFAERPRLCLPSDIYNSPTREAITDDESLWSHRPEEELYDLAADPWERSNLAGRSETAETLAEMHGRLTAWMEATDDPLRHGPIPRSSGSRGDS